MNDLLKYKKGNLMKILKYIFCFLTLSISVIFGIDNLNFSQKQNSLKSVTAELFASNEIGKKKNGVKKKKSKKKKKQSKSKASPYRGSQDGFLRNWS